MSQHNDIRQVVDPIYGATSAIAPVDAGGTASITTDDARNALKLLPTSSIEVDDGVAGLDANKFIYPARFARPVGQAANAQGNLATMNANTSRTFQITNYDSRTTYVMAGINGVATLSVDKITYTAGSVAGAGGFTINGKTYAITITGPCVVTPSITSPVSGSTGLLGTVQMTGSTFSSTGVSDTQKSASWQLAADSSFTAIVSQSLNDTTNLTSWTVSGLSVSTTYFARVRYTGNTLGDSPWSATISFTTNSVFNATNEKATFTNAAADFGAKLALSEDGNYAIIGAPAYAGSGYIYNVTNGTWALQASLPVPAPSDNTNNTGYSVSINLDGTVALLGSLNTGVGVFTRSGTTWTLIQTLLPDTGQFGYSSCITGDATRLAVGARLSTSGAGKVYIYIQSGSTYVLEQAITGPDSSGYFGSIVTLDRTGSHMAEFSANIGKVYIYSRINSVWSLQQSFTPPNTNPSTSVIALSGNGIYLFVGSTDYQASTTGGAVTIYKRTGTVWALMTTILNPTPAANVSFGRQLACNYDATFLVVSVGGNVNKVYAFKRHSSGETWVQSATYTSTVAGDGYGYALDCSIDGTTVMTSASATSTVCVVG